MRCLKLIAVSILFLASCKKEETNPKLSFSAEERKWFIYQNGQSVKFKNAAGDSLVYVVTNVENQFKPEYKDPFTNRIEVGSAEFYSANLISYTDSIFIYFYKEIQNNADPNRMRQTIRWNNATGQFVELEAIKNQTPFTVLTVNNFTYNRVTRASPTTQIAYSWTLWESASYDQQFGFIELKDKSGNVWLRQ